MASVDHAITVLNRAVTAVVDENGIIAEFRRVP